MAATEGAGRPPRPPAEAPPTTRERTLAGTRLRTLTAVALGLPGLIPAAARAGGDDEVRLQFGHYEEGERRLPGVESRYDPIEVDHLRVGATLGLLDRWQVDVDFFQDTWTGASPVTTAPRPFFGNRPSAPDGVSGATPFLSGPLRLDGDLRPLATDRFGIPTGGVDDRLVHTLSSASPETRREVDLRVAHEWDDAEAGMKGGISIEPDYLSGSIGVDARLDLDADRGASHAPPPRVVAGRARGHQRLPRPLHVVAEPRRAERGPRQRRRGNTMTAVREPGRDEGGPDLGSGKGSVQEENGWQFGHG